MTDLCPPPKPSRKREAILDAARSCFLEQGYAAASMDMVAARAAVSKATIYAHFAGKDDLFAAVIHRRCERELYSPEAWPDSGDARAVLGGIGLAIMNLLLSPDALGLYRVVAAEAARQPDLARAFWEAGPGRRKSRLSAVFEELTRRGEMNVPDCWAAADQFVGMLRSEMFQRALFGLPLPEGRGGDSTVAAAVETMLRAYGVTR
jgi:TetR/AcrR family transcriptional repressor of mexJK operon